MIRISRVHALPGLLWLIFSLAGQEVVAQTLAQDTLRPTLQMAKKLRATGDFAGAEAKYAAVFASAQAHYGLQDTFTARVLMDLGLIRYFSGDYRAALSDLKEALSAFRLASGTTVTDTLECLYRTGVVLRETGDLYRAEDFVEAALSVVMADTAASPMTIGKYHNALGNITLRQAHYQVARHHFRRAQQILGPALGEESNYIGAISTNLGVAYLHLDSLPQALAAQQRALAIFAENLAPGNPLFGNAWLNLGEIYLEMGQYGQAVTYFEKASAFWRAHLSPRHLNHAVARNRMGDVRLAQGDGPGALHLYQSALQALAPGMGRDGWRENPAPDSVHSEVELLETLTRKARALAACYAQDSVAYPLQAAFAVYEQISNLTARMRRGYRRESSQQFLSGRTLPAYEEAIALAWSAGSATAMAEGFAFAEHSKAVLLHAALKGAEAQDYAGVPQALLRREMAQKEALVALNQKLDARALGQTPASQAKYRKMIGERFRLEQQHEALLDTFARVYPRYFDLKYAHAVTPLADVQADLDAESAMLVYFWGDAYLYGWAITGSEAQLLRLGEREKMEALCDTLLARVYGRLPLGEASREVYDGVVAPLLKGMAMHGIRRLTVVRDGKLGYVPFALLQSDAAHYLIAEFALSYAPSATLARDKRVRQSATLPYLGVSMTFPGGITLEEAVRKESLAALPNTAREVAVGERVFGGTRLQDDMATEAAFRATASGYEILHLATHTLIDDRNPLYSRLLLQAAPGGAQDGMLHTYELFGLDLNAELVILSACNTGKGSLQKGEGMMSLARGFAYAGCPGILMTHWTVNDRQNADLMAGFFEGLAAGLPKDVALQKAQLAYLEEADEITGHPWYWAAPGLVGEVAPLRVALEGGFAWWIWGLMGLGLLLLFGFLGRKMLRRNMVAS